MAPTVNELKEAVDRMDSGPFLIDAFINNHFYLCALFDSGCLPYAAFNENTVINRNLPRIPINHRLLKLAKDDKCSFKIKYITYATLDINGRKNAFGAMLYPAYTTVLFLEKVGQKEIMLSTKQNNTCS